MKTVKWIIFSLLALIILLVILKLNNLIGKKDVVKVTTEKVIKRTIVESVNASGKISPETEIKISSEVSGEITDLFVQEGDSVKKGQALVRVGSGNIISPIKGTVLLINIKKGERVTGNSMMAGTEIMRIADFNKIEVRVDVGESDIVKVNVNDSATIYVDAYNNKKFKGVVTRIASSNNSAASIPGGSIGTDVINYKVYIQLFLESYQDLMDSAKPKSFLFRPGMSASADIKTRTHENRLAVPINAVTIRDKGDSTFEKSVTSEKNTDGKTSQDVDDLEEVVFVLQKDGTVKKAKVKTDIQDINYIEILGGLNEGDEVITGPYDVVSKTLKIGDKVKVVSKSDLFDKKK